MILTRLYHHDDLNEFIQRKEIRKLLEGMTDEQIEGLTEQRLLELIEGTPEELMFRSLPRGEDR